MHKISPKILMKNLLVIALVMLATQAIAQNNEETLHPTAVSVGNMMAKGMCDCFNEHALNKLSPTARQGLEKLAKRNVTTKEEAQRVLSIKEIMSISKETQDLMPEEGDFAECKDDVVLGTLQFQGQITELLANKVITEEEFDRQTQLQTLRFLKNTAECKVVYYLYMIGKE